jgi:hypothetical protein
MGKYDNQNEKKSRRAGHMRGGNVLANSAPPQTHSPALLAEKLGSVFQKEPVEGLAANPGRVHEYFDRRRGFHATAR